MSFTPRSFSEILTDMIAFVQARTTVTDFTVGSVVRTVLEAAALEDDEQYFQMVQLLDIFSYTTAAGTDLDRRLADFNITRLPAKTAFGKVSFTNGNLVSDQAAVDTVSGSTTIQIFDSTGFPVTGFPYTLRLGEGTSRVQDVIASALNTSTNTFIVSALVSDSEIADRVSLVTGASSHTLAPSTNVQAPPTTAENSKIYRTTELATIIVGNYFSNEVTAVATTAGPDGDTGAGRVTQFLGAAPFSGAGVTNFRALEGGSSAESDSDFRARAVETLQSLSRGTILAIKAASVGVEDLTTGQRVVSANVLEDFAAVPDEVIVYIDDGTGLVPDTVVLSQDSLAVGGITVGDATIVLNDATDFPSSGYVLVAEDFLIEYVSVSGNILTLAGTAPSSVAAGQVVRRVDTVTFGAEESQRRFNLQNPPIVRSTDRIYIKDPLVAGWVIQSANTDYILNKGTGEFSFVDLAGLGVGTQVVAHYSYYTNLVAETQKVLEGSPGDSVNYPGVKAAGVFLSVEAPISKRVTVVVSISAETTFVESDLAPLVQREIEVYISSLKIGSDVILSRIIDVAHNVQGVRSVTVQLPISDIIVLENELPVAFDSSGNSLVTVL